MIKVKLTKNERSFLNDILPQLNSWYEIWEELQKEEAVIPKDAAKKIYGNIQKRLQALKKSLGDEWRYNTEYRIIEGMSWKFRVR